MTSWLFVSVEKGLAEDSGLQSSVCEAALKSHAPKFSKARLRKKRLQTLKKSIVRMPAPSKPDNKKKIAADRTQTSEENRFQNDFHSNASSPRTYLDSSNLEPFAPEHMRGMPQLMQEALEYTYEVLWPINSPVIQGQALKSTVEFWRRSAIQSPLVFYSQVSNAASLCLAKATDTSQVRQLSTLRTIYQARGIQLIKEAIDELRGPPSTALITCIMNIHGQGAQILESNPYPFVPESPIFAAFNLKLYGRFAYPRQHFPALTELLRQRGGINTLPPGSANPLQLADLAGANLKFTAPKFPLLASIAEKADNSRANFDDEALQLLRRLGMGFPSCLEINDCSMIQILSDACHLTAAIDQYHRKSPERFPLNVLAVKAIAFQHRLLSITIPTNLEGEPVEVSVEDLLWDITRISTLIYSDFMIFPTAEARQGRPRLAAILRGRLVHYLSMYSETNSQLSNFDDLFLWSLVLGGIAASTSPDREWYVSELFQQLDFRKVNWEALDNVLHSFLYWDYVFSLPVTNLWIEAQSLDTQGTLALGYGASEHDSRDLISLAMSEYTSREQGN